MPSTIRVAVAVRLAGASEWLDGEGPRPDLRVKRLDNWALRDSRGCREGESIENRGGPSHRPPLGNCRDRNVQKQEPVAQELPSAPVTSPRPALAVLQQREAGNGSPPNAVIAPAQSG